MIKKAVVVSLLSFASIGAKADIIKCSFTEPFITTTYSMTQSTLTVKDDAGEKETVVKDVSFQIKSAGVFELVSKDGKVLQKLILNNNGSDGMSENIYPYEVQDYLWTGDSKQALFGGCSSNALKVKIVDPGAN